jgi:hypothetical protein
VPVEEPDPFDGLTFDDDWIAGAPHHEPPAELRVDQAGILRDQEEERLAQVWRSRRRRKRRRQALVLTAILLFGGAVAFADRNDGSGPTTWAASDRGPSAAVVLGGRPTPARATSPTPLGSPADPGASGGTFGFTATQSDGATPVTYDPCRPIDVVVNETEAPPGTEGIVEQAVDELAEVTGLSISITGPTTEPASNQRAAFQPDRYGDRWAPVLITWTDAGEVPALTGNVAGVAGSVAVTGDDGHRTYVSGLVALDGPDLQRILGQEADGARIVEDIVLHELGHLVGLDHVDSTDELLYPQGQRDLHGYQRGDRAGLTRLGQGRCVDLL